MSHWRVPMAPRCTGSPPSLLAYPTTMESLWTSRPTCSVLSFFIADLRSHGQCQRALGGSDLAEANPRVETEVSLSPRQSLCLGRNRATNDEIRCVSGNQRGRVRDIAAQPGPGGRRAPADHARVVRVPRPKIRA